MRIPRSKVYRAFPELDAFSDEECERFVLRAERAEASFKAGSKVLYGFGGFVTGVVLAIVVAIVFQAMFNTARSAGWLPRGTDGHYTVVAALVILCIAGGLFVGSLHGRDVWLRKAIAGKLMRTVCPVCKYSLLGLTIIESSQGTLVQCPECGRDLLLRDHGLIADDLIARHASEPPPE